MKVILFNSPPRSGKDLAANYLAEYINEEYDDWVGLRYMFAKPLKETTHAMYGLDYLEFDAFEETKDKPAEEFFGLTPRQAYINTSELMIKPVLGNDHWGKVCVEFLKGLGYLADSDGMDTVVVISDCGFIEELAPIKEYVGAENLTMIRLHRNGTSFSNDSRTFIEDHDIKVLNIDNNSSTKELFIELETIIDSILEE